MCVGVPEVLVDKNIPVRNPDFISVDRVVKFVRKALLYPDNDSIKGTLPRFLDQYHSRTLITYLTGVRYWRTKTFSIEYRAIYNVPV